jgi:hypothetical protein
VRRTEEIADERCDGRGHRRSSGAAASWAPVDSSELPMHGDDALRADAATARTGAHQRDDLRAVLSHESARKARKGFIEAARTHIERFAARRAAASW